MSEPKGDNNRMCVDVPSPIDLLNYEDALQWSNEVTARRPYRRIIFQAIIDRLQQLSARQILELGSGPGFFAQALLSAIPQINYTAFDFSPAMHQLARDRLGPLAAAVRFVTDSFLRDNWHEPFSNLDAVVSVQAVHEIRHKSKTPHLFTQIHQLLKSGGVFFYCDHVCDAQGMANNELFLNEAEQEQSLCEAGFSPVDKIARIGTLALWVGRRS